MKRNLFLLFYCFLFSSCATLFSKKNCFVQVSSDIPNSKIKIKDSIYSLPAKISLKRSNEKVAIELINDTISNKYVLKPSISPAFIFGNLAFVYFFPIAQGVDFTNQNRYYYRKKINFNSSKKDSIIRTNVEENANKFANRFSNYFKKKYPTQKGQFNFNFNVTSLNFLKYKPRNEDIQRDFALPSAKIGVGYFYKNKTFVSLDFKALTSLIVFGESFAPYERTFINLYSSSITNNNVLNRFSVGYGVNYSIYSWKKQFINYQPSQSSITKTNYALGLKGNIYYQLNSLMFVGLNYDNSFFQINPNSKLISNQNINFEVLLKIKIRKNIKQ